MHIRFIAESKEAVSESRGYPQHVLIYVRKLDANPASKSRGTTPQVNCNVENGTSRTANELALRSTQLVVQAADDVANGPGVIVLSEMDVNAGLFEGALIPRLEKESACIAPYFRRDQQDARQCRRCELHRLLTCDVVQFA